MSPVAGCSFSALQLIHGGGPLLHKKKSSTLAEEQFLRRAAVTIREATLRPGQSPSPVLGTRSRATSVVCFLHSSGIHESRGPTRPKPVGDPGALFEHRPSPACLPDRSYSRPVAAAMPGVFFKTQRISCRLSRARLRDALDASSSSSKFLKVLWSHGFEVFGRTHPSSSSNTNVI